MDQATPALDQETSLSRLSHSEDTSIELLDGEFVVLYNNSDWIEQPEIAVNQGIDMVYQHRSNEVFIAVEANRMQMPIENLPDLAIEELQATSPDVNIDRRGFRTVNGVTVVYWEYTASTSGIDLFIALMLIAI